MFYANPSKLYQHNPPSQALPVIFEAASREHFVWNVFFENYTTAHTGSFPYIQKAGHKYFFKILAIIVVKH